MESGKASIDCLNDSGASILSNACNSEDCNIDVVQYLLSKTLKYGVNHRRCAKTIKWKLIYALARGLVCTRFVKTGIFAKLSTESGATPLHYAVRRGDCAVIELLIQFGANPMLVDDLGNDMIAYCDAFPEIKDATLRVLEETKRVQRKKKSKEASKHETKFISKIISR